MIISICFYPDKKNIGGGQIPAYAFSEWCTEIGFECSTNIESHADWYFLATPGGFIDEKPWEPTKPFALMVHAEFDQRIYPNYDFYFNHPLCAAIVKISSFYNEANVPMFHWHPCTFPKYLLKPGDTFDNSKRSGLIFASRISQWKEYNKLSHLSRFKPFLDAVDNRIDIYGLVTSNFDMVPGNLNITGVQHDVYDYQANKVLLSGYKYIWDCSWNKEISPHYKRLNLSAVEAMKFGCIPIVDRNTCHPSALSYAVDLECGFPNNYYDRQNLMKNCVLNSEYSYDSVRSQVGKIINYMESIK